MSNIRETISQFIPENDDNIFSQQFLRATLHNFKSSGTRNSEYNSLDEPGAFFFKPVFYFDGPSMNDSTPAGGLLHPSWLSEANTYRDTRLTEEAYVNINNPKSSIGEGIREDASLVNSAYNYLLRNDEKERAKNVKLFIEILSSMCTRFPWYFQSIAGLDAAIEKKFFREPKIDEAKRQLKFELLADAYDTRIGTMLDCYRSACFSWQSKREIVPSNLRKFDMGLFIYLKPVQRRRGTLISRGNSDRDIDTTSYKYLEFHNCEINFDSFKFGDTLTNVEAAGNPMKYSLVIDYDECFEDRYNDQFVGIIGDSIIQDMYNISVDSDYLNHQDTPHGLSSDSFLNSVLKNVYSATIDKGLDYVQGKATSLVLGNIYGFQAANAVRRLTDGQIFGLGKKNYKPDETFNDKSLYIPKPTPNDETFNDKSLYVPKPTPTPKTKLGNIYHDNLNKAQSVIRAL